MYSTLEWQSADTPPAGFVQVLLYLPEEKPYPTVYEGYYVEGAGYRSPRLGKVEPTMWAYMPEPKQTVASLISFYDKEEIYDNCTVQVLTNTKTGETSIGWRRNDE